MHFVITYELRAEGTRRVELEDKIDSILTPYRHVKRLSSLYIVGISKMDEWEELRRALNDFSNDIPEEFHYVMTSPESQPSKYNGILYRGEWDEVNAITMS